jgi:hypothetical protein
LESQLIPGKSKHEVKQAALDKARAEGLSGRERIDRMNEAVFREGIFSYGTLRAYLDAAKDYCNWLKERHPEVREMVAAKAHVGDYLCERRDAGLSAWTLKRDRAALRKAYGDRELARDVELPFRRVSEVERSRLEREMDRRLDRERHRDVIDFARATGLRRSELQRVRVEHVREREGRLAVWTKGKGGKERWARVREDMQERVREIVRQREREGRDRVFDRVPVRLDVHGLRREYAREREREERQRWERERDRIAEELTRSLGREPELRELERELEKRVAREVSQDLGHERLDVIRHYR